MKKTVFGVTFFILVAISFCFTEENNWDDYRSVVLPVFLVKKSSYLNEKLKIPRCCIEFKEKNTVSVWNEGGLFYAKITDEALEQLLGYMEEDPERYSRRIVNIYGVVHQIAEGFLDESFTIEKIEFPELLGLPKDEPKTESSSEPSLDIKLLYDVFWTLKSGNKVAGFMLSQKDKSYIFTISDSVLDSDIMLSGTFIVDTDKKGTIITLNQSEVHDNGRLIYQEASITYKVVSVTKDKLVLMNIDTNSNLVFTR